LSFEKRRAWKVGKDLLNFVSSIAKNKFCCSLPRFEPGFFVYKIRKVEDFVKGCVE